MSVADFYHWLDKLGLEYGPSFRGVRELHVGQREALTKVQLPCGLANTQYVMHPAFLDACLHAYPLVLDGAEEAKGDRRNSYLPISLEGFRCYQDGIDKAWVHIRLRSVEKDDTQVVDIRVYDDAERLVADLEGLTVRLLPLAKVQTPRAGTDDLFYRAVWRKCVREAARPEKDRAPASWMIFADAKGVGVALAGTLEAAGHRCHLVYREDALAQYGARPNVDRERTEAPRFSPVAGALRCQRAATVRWRGLPVGIGCAADRRPYPRRIEERQRDDVPRRAGDPAGPCGDSIDEFRGQAAMVCNREHAKNRWPRPAC